MSIICRDWPMRTVHTPVPSVGAMRLTVTGLSSEPWLAETREAANQAFDKFLAKYQAKYEEACECLRKASVYGAMDSQV